MCSLLRPSLCPTWSMLEQPWSEKSVWVKEKIRTRMVLKPCGLCWARGTAWREKRRYRLPLSSQRRGGAVELSRQGSRLKKTQLSGEKQNFSTLVRRKSLMPTWKTLWVSPRHSAQSIKDTKSTLTEWTEVWSFSRVLVQTGLPRFCPRAGA